MLYCSYCDYCKIANDTEERDSCRKYICNYAKILIAPDNLEKATEHPCLHIPEISN